MKSNDEIVMKLARTLGRFDARVIMGDTETFNVEQVRDLLEEIIDRNSEGETNEKKEKG